MINKIIEKNLVYIGGNLALILPNFLSEDMGFKIEKKSTETLRNNRVSIKIIEKDGKVIFTTEKIS